MATQVVARSSKLWSEDADKAALHKRTTFVGGDFFNSGVLFVVCLVQNGTRVCATSLPKTCSTLAQICASFLKAHLCAALLTPASLPM